MDQRNPFVCRFWMRRGILAGIRGVSVFLLAGLSCASPIKKSLPQGKVHEVAEIIYDSLRYRRPGSDAANPQASPGGVDFRTRDRANWRSLDCRKPEDFFAKRISEFSLEKVDACLQSVPADTKVSFKLKRGKTPAWLLEIEPSEENTPGTPDCLVQLLKKIPLPREVLFMGRSSDGTLSCFASGQDWEEDIYVDLRIPYFAKKGMTLTLPGDYLELGKDPQARALRWMDSMVVSLWAREGEGRPRVLPSVIFPDELCKKCLGESEFNRMKQPVGPAPDPWLIRSL
jgi:hypothetical protein